MAAALDHPRQLPPGGRIAVIGGGPAGSFFALFALDFARQLGLRLTVTIFEPRDFSRTGPWGCNMCAGLIPVRVLRELEELSIRVPSRIIRERISRYTLHTAAGQICLSQPDPDSDVVSVYRGSGPRCASPWPHPISFDGFLLETARARGAEVIRQRVTTVTLTPHPVVETQVQRFHADLVVLATGINAHPVHLTDLRYSPPPRQQMAQAEICLEGEEAVRQALGNSVHIFLPPDGSLRFGTLVPKGPCINVSLLGDALPRGTVARFLALPEVARLLPDTVPRACGCRPRIAVGAAHPLFADRFVAVGDAGITRLYKNGIGTALRTARQAAYTALVEGIDAHAFAAGYAPLCREIAWDNRAGRFLFAFTRVFQRNRWLMLPHLRSIAAEQSLPPEERFHSRLLWGMFTGACPYQELLAMACHPRLHVSLFRHLLNDLPGCYRNHPVRARLED
ncbi:MAG: FAD-dependent oxidoreductase [Chloroflexi bacterium]|nr:MAG: FAD-dependent oxidoreductase [Chloroflexota bacterium]